MLCPHCQTENCGHVSKFAALHLFKIKVVARSINIAVELFKQLHIFIRSDTATRHKADMLMESLNRSSDLASTLQSELTERIERIKQDAKL